MKLSRKFVRNNMGMTLAEAFPEEAIVLEVGKWYYVRKQVFNYQLNDKSYGMGGKHWVTSTWTTEPDSVDEKGWMPKKASDERVLKALTKCAKAKGFVKGTYFNNVGQEQLDVQQCNGVVEICTSMSNGEFGLQFGNGNGLIMKGGVWAEIVELKGKKDE
jgi:hypothetical protein